MSNKLISLITALDSDLKTFLIVMWVLIIICTIFIELHTSDLIACWISLSGVICLILTFLEISLYIQFIVVVVITLSLTIATRPLLKRFNLNEEILTNVDKLIGMIGVITKPILEEENGEVKVNFQKWIAISKDGFTFENKQKVLITAIEGNKLVVDKIE